MILGYEKQTTLDAKGPECPYCKRAGDTGKGELQKEWTMKGTKNPIKVQMFRCNNPGCRKYFRKGIKLA